MNSVYDLRREDQKFIIGMFNCIDRLAAYCAVNGIEWRRLTPNAGILAAYNSLRCVVFALGIKLAFLGSEGILEK
jgi:hypothetical protein